jgi:uncharacterized protein (TIGR02996 family)
MLPPPFRAMDPADGLAWLAIADWLEEHDQPDRAELVRLTHHSCQLSVVSCQNQSELTTDNWQLRTMRLMELLAAGVEPCVATLTNSIGMEFAYIPAGTFLMGSPEDEVSRSDDEGPAHEVTITKAFYLGRYEVTQGEWQAVMGTDPSHFSATGVGKDQVKDLETSRFPVEQVSHEDAVEFCKRLSARKDEKEKKHLYRLPTEAEWEYACRGGAGSNFFHFGNCVSSDQANINGKIPYCGAAKGPYLGRTCAVGSYRPNGYGLYDMHGNVWEWCSDWYEEGYYAAAPVADPSGGTGSNRVVRGGGWIAVGSYCRSASRHGHSPTIRILHVGFRIALVPF